MTITPSLLAALWLAFVVCWALADYRRKERTVGPRGWWREAGLRLVILGLVVLALRVPALMLVPFLF